MNSSHLKEEITEGCKYLGEDILLHKTSELSFSSLK